MPCIRNRQPMTLHLVILGAGSIVLVCGHGSALRAGIILLQGERQEKHDCGGNTKYPVRVDICQSGSLRLNSRIDSGERLALRRVRAESRVSELLDKAVHGSPELCVPHARTRNQRSLMKL